VWKFGIGGARARSARTSVCRTLATWIQGASVAPERHRFEATLDGAHGRVGYRLRAGVMKILHAEVDPALEGRGAAARSLAHSCGRRSIPRARARA
jgi:hypothetical protein